MDDKYYFSAMVPMNLPFLLRRKWWEFWKHDTILMKVVNVRKSVGLSEEEGNVLLNMDGPTGNVLRKMLGEGSTCWQLEECRERPSEYIKSDNIK